MRPVPATLRAAVFARDGGCCVICGRGLDPDCWEAHHRRYRSRGGAHELANLIAVCFNNCHQTIHAHPAASEAHGWSISRYGPGPTDVPVRYWSGDLRLLSNDPSGVLG